MDQLIGRVGGQIEGLIRRKEDLSRENVVLRRENDRLQSRLTEITAERDILEKRVKLSGRRVESALSRLNLMTEEG